MISINVAQSWLCRSVMVCSHASPFQIDIELPGDMLLREAHDIGEALQNKVEALPEVDRAFVHLDYDSLHPPEHGSGRWLIP